MDRSTRSAGRRGTRPPVSPAAILDSVGVGIFAMDLQGRLVYFNAAARASLGYGPDEEARLLGAQFFELIAPEARAEGAATARRGRERPLDDHAFRIDLRRKDGTVFTSDVQLTTLWQDGAVAGRVGVARLVAPDGDVVDAAAVERAATDERKRVLEALLGFAQQMMNAPRGAARAVPPEASDASLLADVKRRQDLDATDLAILRLVTEGAANAEIGRRVHLSAAAVKARIGRLMRRLGASRRAELSAQALRIGLV